MKLPQLSIATKLYLIFALLATVTIGLAVAEVVSTRHHRTLAVELEAAHLGAANVERVNALIYAVVMESRGVYMATDKAAVATYANGLLRFERSIGPLLEDWRRAVRSDDAVSFDAFARRIAAFQEFRRELARRATQESQQAARAWGDNNANRAVRTALNGDLNALAQIYAGRSRSLSAELEREINRTSWLLGLLGLSAMLLAAAGAMMIARAVARPLARITTITAAVAAGERGVTVPYGERGDEIGALARSIVVFQEAMRRNVELSNVLADQERSQRQERVAAEIARFGADVEATLAELGHISDQMQSASTQLTDAADNAAERTAGAAYASSDASANVRDIASAAEELAMSVTEIDRQVAQSNAIATKAVGEAERSNAAVAELNQAVGRIGDVVRLITDIAEQTNLLALNATIEAARAGDAGRGFAVVANEVKALAGQTARATQDISAQIGGMQHATTRSIEAISAIEATIRSIGEISGAIAAAVTEQGAATHEIARAVDTAALRTGDTAGEVARVGEAAAQTRASAGEVGAVAEELGQVAVRIRRQVDRFFQRLRAA